MTLAIGACAQARGVPTVEPVDFVASAGQGLQCVVDGAVVLLGNRGWVHENGLSLSEAQEAQVLLASGLGVGVGVG